MRPSVRLGDRWQHASYSPVFRGHWATRGRQTTACKIGPCIQVCAGGRSSRPRGGRWAAACGETGAHAQGGGDGGALRRATAGSACAALLPWRGRPGYTPSPGCAAATAGQSLPVTAQARACLWGQRAGSWTVACRVGRIANRRKPEIANHNRQLACGLWLEQLIRSRRALGAAGGCALPAHLLIWLCSPPEPIPAVAGCAVHGDRVTGRARRGSSSES